MRESTAVWKCVSLTCVIIWFEVKTWKDWRRYGINWQQKSNFKFKVKCWILHEDAWRERAHLDFTGFKQDQTSFFFLLTLNKRSKKNQEVNWDLFGPCSFIKKQIYGHFCSQKSETNNRQLFIELFSKKYLKFLTQILVFFSLSPFHTHIFNLYLCSLSQI